MLISSAVVVGTGVMGPSIAAALACADVRTIVAGRNPERVRAALVRARQSAGRRAADRIMAAPIEAFAFADSDLVVETIIEDFDAKSRLFGRISNWCSLGSIIVTNTSSLPLDELGSSVVDPSRFAGLHFLNPAHETNVVEVVRGGMTNDYTFDMLSRLVTRMRKFPISVHRPVPGFVWNRIQAALLRECLHILEEGVADVASIEAAISDGLAPRWLATGPFATADLGGTETFRRVAEQLFPKLSTITEPIGPLVRGEAFYEWREDARTDIYRLRRDALSFGAKVALQRRATMSGACSPYRGSG